MAAIEAAVAAGERDRAARADARPLAPRRARSAGRRPQVRDGLEAWADLGVLPIAVMSSTSGGQAKAIGELFAAYA